MPDKTMRIDLDLYEQVAKVAERADRTPRKQIERWLREALRSQIQAVGRAETAPNPHPSCIPLILFE